MYSIVGYQIQIQIILLLYNVLHMAISSNSIVDNILRFDLLYCD